MIEDTSTLFTVGGLAGEGGLTSELHHKSAENATFATFRLIIEVVPLVSSQVVGSYKLLLNNAGIASMHTAVTRFNTVIMLDRTNIGPSQINLPDGRCRNNPQDLTLKNDCTAHSVMFTPGPNTVRPLFIFTDTWCSSGQFLPDGTMLQTGGDFEGKFKIRRLAPCPSTGNCDWVEDPNVSLKDPRWYATNQILPDGRMIIIGGRAVFTYEFFPRPSGQGSFFLKLLNDTNNFENDNYYPYVHLLPDGNLYIFANRDSILFNYKTNTVLRTYPTIPGNPRNYPSAGSSVLLPLDGPSNYNSAEVLVCGGAQLGAFKNPSKQFACSDTCGRMVVTSAMPSWFMETMPIRRCMGDMIILPSREILIINGAQSGSQGWGDATNPALNPVVYRPAVAPGPARFVTQPAATIPRMYHSTANLLADGRVLIAGSNTHQFYTFTGEFPTELRVEAWSPYYFNPPYAPKKPTITSSPARITYGSVFKVTFSCPSSPMSVEMNLVSAYFTTHSYSQGQRLVRMKVSTGVAQGNNVYEVTVTAPPNANIAPPQYYMLFPVMSGVAGSAVWVQMVSP
ncbi:hypothetical protein GOP47_0007247 [Adiantum capillus-veneris]|uniref:Galactose oxidase n=1 Tax=Adiantum capillus-veneris TaxID=13818 RepID=A0A9D4ZJ19_ADICA|nr:hypothetical protein GOP47_0007247 [Adiantum capillus-veneris]